MFLCLDQNATKLAKLGFDTGKRLADMVGTLLDIKGFETN